MAYEIGQNVRIPVTVRNEAGVPTDATMAVSVLRHDDTPYTGLVIVDDPGAGLYHVDVVVDTEGITRYVWTASGAVVSVYTGQFYVRPRGQRVVSVDEVKLHLNKSMTVTTDDDEIRDWIDAATYVLEREVGVIIPRSVSELHNGGQPEIFLHRGPVLTVTSLVETVAPGVSNVLTVEPAGGPFTEFQFTLNRRKVTRRRYGYNGPFAWGCANVAGTYTVGRRPVPPNHRTAALELVGHYWRASQLANRGPARAAQPGAPTDITTMLGIAMPNRIAILLGNKRAPRLG